MIYKMLSYACVGLLCMNACVTPKAFSKKEPAGFTLYYTNYQGLTGKSENYKLLYNTQASTNDNASETKFITLTKEQAHEIYSVLQENKFETIEATQLQTADRGGYTLEFASQNILTKKSHSGSEYVVPSNLTRFLNCVKVVEKYLPKNTK